MDAEEALDRVLGPLARWLVRHPVPALLQTIMLGGVVLAVGVFVLHSRFVVVVALVSIALTLLFSAMQLLARLGTRRSRRD